MRKGIDIEGGGWWATPDFIVDEGIQKASEAASRCMLLGFICYLYRRASRTGESFPSYARFKIDLGLSTATVSKYIKEAEALGLLRVIRNKRPDGGDAPNHYVLTHLHLSTPSSASKDTPSSVKKDECLQESKTKDNPVEGQPIIKDTKSFAMGGKALRTLVGNMGGLWTERCGGVLNWGRTHKAIKPLTDIYGPGEIAEGFRRYLDGTQIQYASVEAFVRKAGSWIPMEEKAEAAAPMELF